MADGLLNKASIILTPTGYKAGTLYNVAPVVEPYEDFDFARASVASRVNSSGLVEMVGRTLGSELVVNGDFATDSDWTLGTGWSIADGKLKSDGTINSSCVQDNIFNNAGNLYEINIDISVSSGSLDSRIRMSGSGVSSITISNISSGGSYKFYAIAVSGRQSINIVTLSGNTAVYEIDNVSVKEVIDTNNIPRISYDSNGDNGHILLEPTSRNLVPYSENFEGGSWDNASVGTKPTLEGGYTAPDGTDTAYKISNANQNSFWYYPSVSDTNYARTIWARTVSGTGTAQLLAHNSNTNNIFNLTETWQRFEINTVVSVGQENLYAVDFRGDGTLTELLIWGAQSEALSYATSYIPTLTGSTVTRATETATGAGSADLINSTEGVLYAEIAALADDADGFRVLGISDGGASNRVFIGYNDSNQIYANIGTSTLVGTQYTPTNASNFHKVALKYENNNCKFFVDGTQIGTTLTSITIPSGMNSLQFNSGAGGSVFYGDCKALAVFNEALSDSELTQLTT